MKKIPALAALILFLCGNFSCMTGVFTDSRNQEKKIDETKLNESHNTMPYKAVDSLDPKSLDESIKRNSPASGASAKVIETARTYMNGEKTVTGSCWDYLNSVYLAAGFDASRRVSAYSGKSSGPFCDPSLLVAGDWIMFNNLGYQGVGHSGLFIQWVDYENRTALVIDHPGLDKTSSGRYRIYDITELWGVVRPSP